VLRLEMSSLTRARIEVARWRARSCGRARELHVFVGVAEPVRVEVQPDPPAQATHVRTVRSVGYVFDLPEHREQQPVPQPVPQPVTAELVAGMLDTVIAEAARAGAPVTVDLDALVDRAETVARGRGRRVDPGP